LKACRSPWSPSVLMGPVVAFLAFSVLLTGCARPPGPSAATFPGGTAGPAIPGSGLPVQAVKIQTKPAFSTVMHNGEEWLVARNSIGQFGGTLRENQIGEGPKTFNSWASADATSSTMGDALFPGLVTMDAYTGEAVPYMAHSVEISEDRMTYTVKLRPGLKWSDGKPITADDVVFTWNDIVKQGLGNASSRDSDLVDGKFPEVSKVDDMTIRFKTAKPFAPFIRNLGTSIAPKHILAPIVAKGNQAFTAFWGVQDAAQHPEKFVSSGMWLLESYDPRLKVVFKRNPHFFMADTKGQRLPYLDRYVIKFVGDHNNQELQFEQGNVDVYSVPGNFVARVRHLKKPSFHLFNLGPSSGTIFMAINLNNRKDGKGKPIIDPIKASWFNDVNFRQAINHAIHRQDIVDNILKGVGAPLFTAESLSSIHLDPSLAQGFDADPEESRRLLAQSGFKWDKQNQLFDKNGHRVEFTLLTNSGNNEREATGVNIKQDLDALGMKVNFKPIEFNVLGDKLHHGDWETMIMGLTGNNLEPHGGVNIWKSDGFLHLFNQRVVEPGKPTNIRDRLPWEAELDKIFEEGAQVFEDGKRKAIYNRYQQIVSQQAPLVYLYSPLQIVAIRKRLQNIDPTPLGGVTHNMEALWIDEDKEK
jgi:peptide/nickel transport system substrate-binding protein